MASVIRLSTSVDLADERFDLREMMLSARHEAVLATGHRVLLLDDRGWGGSGPPDLWARTPVEEIVATARTVVGPDEPFDGMTSEQMAAGHWAELRSTLRRAGVVADAEELRRLPHEVTLSSRLLARLAGAS